VPLNGPVAIHDGSKRKTREGALGKSLLAHAMYIDELEPLEALVLALQAWSSSIVLGRLLLAQSLERNCVDQPHHVFHCAPCTYNVIAVEIIFHEQNPSRFSRC